MKLTTILSNYQEFRESYKKIGYSQPTINLNDKRQIELLLNTVITDIILYNDILNIYDYDKKEKEKILNFLNKLNLKHKTFLHILTQKNIDNYYEDASILEDEYNDTQLFESLIQHKIENMSFITESQNFEQEDMELFEFLDKHNFTVDEVLDNKYVSEKIYNYLENVDLLDIYEESDINLLARKYLDYWENEKINN